MSTVQLIPVGKIRVLNPRARSKTKFAEIVDSIAKLGVKSRSRLVLDRDPEGNTTSSAVRAGSRRARSSA